MAVEVVNLACPNCGASVSTGQKECKYCHSAVTVITLNSVFSMPFPQVSSYNRNYRQLVDGQRDVCPDHSTLNLSNAICYLKLRMYDNALPAFEKAFEDNFDSTETLFYASVSLLKGRIAFVTQRKDIDKAMEYLNAAQNKYQ
ncbi:hypothetical protein FACS1894177_08590 [Bacteroidia bacterium]|nr:hypothetical protein FACS1894177_08590 [Bacteroidia bacterium]